MEAAGLPLKEERAPRAPRERKERKGRVAPSLKRKKASSDDSADEEEEDDEDEEAEEGAPEIIAWYVPEGFTVQEEVRSQGCAPSATSPDET